MTTFEIMGNSYPLAFTIRAVDEVCERYGSLENFDNLYKEKTDIELFKEYIWVLRTMMNAAAAKVKAEGGKGAETVPELESMYEVMEWGSFGRIRQAINECIASDSARTVEAEEDPKAAKNAGAAQK